MQTNQIRKTSVLSVKCKLSYSWLPEIPVGDGNNSGLIPSRVKPMTLKSVFTASLLDAQHQKNSVKNKPASLLVVPLGKALSGIPPFWCDR